ncbi:MAG TPA: Na+/H+ antiporter subunit E [Xanthobacteraceae bacterium]|nr:Na+/H+ antiporter subunit E [Xanthobacteraceae bacterium]
MTRLLPHPKLFLALLALWLLLWQSLSPGALALGVVVAFGASWAMAALQPVKVKIYRPGALLRFAGLVTADVVRSGVTVGRMILGRERPGTRSGFITVPLRLRSHHGLAALAVALSAAPGSLWVSYDPARGTLLLHILDLADEAQWIETITQRYEPPLMEAFEWRT